MEKRTLRKTSYSQTVLTVLATALIVGSVSYGARELNAVEEEHDASDATTVEESSSTDSDFRRAEKPKTIRKEQRDQMQAENAMRERVGQFIEGNCEQIAEGGEPCNFEALKEQAISMLGQGVANLYTEQQEPDEPQLGCFDIEGNITKNRFECAEDQSGFFGMLSGEEDEEESLGAWDEEFTGDGYGTTQSYQYNVPSYNEMDQFMGRHDGGREHGAAQGMGYQNGGFPHDGGMQGMPDMNATMDMMGTMFGKLPKVFAIFEREGIAVPSESRAAAEKATLIYEQNSGACRNMDMTACMALAEIGESMEPTMRPPMERAMQQAVMSGKIGFDRVMAVGMEIEALMSEGMPRGPMNNGFGPPPSHMNMGPPPGMQGGYGPPPGMPGDYGYPGQGFPQGY